jgi:hypothetical protein
MELSGSEPAVGALHRLRARGSEVAEVEELMEISAERKPIGYFGSPPSEYGRMWRRLECGAWSVLQFLESLPENASTLGQV